MRPGDPARLFEQILRDSHGNSTVPRLRGIWIRSIPPGPRTNTLVIAIVVLRSPLTRPTRRRRVARKTVREEVPLMRLRIRLMIFSGVVLLAALAPVVALADGGTPVGH